MSSTLTEGIARRVALVALCAALAACEQPEEPEPPVIEVAYLLDRIDGEPPPAPVCEQGSVDQLLRFESIALADDGSYGRLQEIQIGSDPPLQQEERGEFEHTEAAILLHDAAGGVTALALLDSAGEHVRRIHTCGDTLRYASVPVLD
ncbi:MAG TPA: hypothetical protein VMN78_05455 [Longimicrobiales bacterium]|nr:hypothetical protein [Longimicrobiales bacterium]